MECRTSNEQFSPLQIKIIEMITEEKPNKEIAFVLNYSQRTIEYNITQLFKKMDVNTRVGIVAQAFRRKLV